MYILIVSNSFNSHIKTLIMVVVFISENAHVCLFAYIDLFINIKYLRLKYCVHLK